MANEEIKPLKRIRFFSGFRTTAADWNAAEDYHNRKRKLHNQHLHTLGIVPDYIGNLEVKAATDGKHIMVDAGCAIDAMGRELLLPTPKTLQIKLEKYKPKQTIYVVLLYHTKNTDFQKDVNPEYQDFKFIEECPVVRFKEKEPSTEVGTDDGVELARISLDKSGTISDDQIDTFHVKVAGPRVTLRNTFACTHQGSTELTKEKKYSLLAIDDVDRDEPKRLYFVNAWPEEEATVNWQIESKREGTRIVYSVRFSLAGEPERPKTHISYLVYRLL